MEINIYQICIINHRAIIQYAGYIESTVFDPENYGIYVTGLITQILSHQIYTQIYLVAVMI